MPSLIGGFALGSLFAISSIRIRDGLDYAYEAASAYHQSPCATRCSRQEAACRAGALTLDDLRLARASRP